MTAPRTGIVIVNWDLCQDTLACLRSVFGMSHPATWVCVVDNGSSDDSVVQIRRAFPQVCQLINDRNEGFGAAANRGIEQAMTEGCDYVLVLNNDTVVDVELLEQLLAVAETDPRIGILSPRILFHDDPERTWQLASRWHRWLPMPVNLSQAGDALLEADFVTGCAILLRRRLLEEVGLFDPEYYMYGEDVDLCARARLAGYRVVAVPRARTWHKVAASARRISADMRYWQARGHIRIYRRYSHGPLARLAPLYGLTKMAWDLARHVVAGQLDLVAPLLRGVRDGLRRPVP